MTLILDITPGLARDMQAAAHYSGGLTLELWALTALFKQAYADRQFYQSTGCTWPQPTGAYAPPEPA